MRLPTTAVLFVLLVVAIAAVSLVAFANEISWQQFPEVSLFIVLIVIASYLVVQDPAGSVVSSAGTLFYVAMFVFNPITAFFVVALGYAIGNTLPRSWVTWRVLFNGSQMGLSTLMGALVFRTLGGDLGGSPLASQILPSTLGPLAHLAANNLFVGYFISQVRGVPFLRTWLGFVREFLRTNLLGVPSAILIALLYTRVHFSFIFLFLVALPFQRSVLKLLFQERITYFRIIDGLVTAAELSLPGMKGHARRVADLSTTLCRELTVADRDVDLIEYAALLHDVGMIGFDDALASRVAYQERLRIIDDHVRIGAQIASELPRKEIREIILRHHARYMDLKDLRGLPPAVSLGARVVALAEEVDSRLHGLYPHDQREPLDAVVAFVEEARGSLFDPLVVDAFLSVVRKRELDVEGASPGSHEGPVDPRRVVSSEA